MENYKLESEIGQDLILTYLKNRMKEKKVTQKKLAEILQVSVTTLIRYFKQETPMPLRVYLEICGALELRPYLISTESEEFYCNSDDGELPYQFGTFECARLMAEYLKQQFDTHGVVGRYSQEEIETAYNKGLEDGYACLPSNL